MHDPLSESQEYMRNNMRKSILDAARARLAEKRKTEAIERKRIKKEKEEEKRKVELGKSNMDQFKRDPMPGMPPSPRMSDQQRQLLERIQKREQEAKEYKRQQREEERKRWLEEEEKKNRLSMTNSVTSAVGREQDKLQGSKNTKKSQPTSNKSSVRKSSARPSSVCPTDRTSQRVSRAASDGDIPKNSTKLIQIILDGKTCSKRNTDKTNHVNSSAEVIGNSTLMASKPPRSSRNTEENDARALGRESNQMQKPIRVPSRSPRNTEEKTPTSYSPTKKQHDELNMKKLFDLGEKWLNERSFTTANELVAARSKKTSNEFPIHRAVRENRADIVEALIAAHGADPKAVDSKGRIPVQLAAKFTGRTNERIPAILLNTKRGKYQDPDFLNKSHGKKNMPKSPEKENMPKSPKKLNSPRAVFKKFISRSKSMSPRNSPKPKNASPKKA